MLVLCLRWQWWFLSFKIRFLDYRENVFSPICSALYAPICFSPLCSEPAQDLMPEAASQILPPYPMMWPPLLLQPANVLAQRSPPMFPIRHHFPVFPALCCPRNPEVYGNDVKCITQWYHFHFQVGRPSVSSEIVVRGSGQVGRLSPACSFPILHLCLLC